MPPWLTTLIANERALRIRQSARKKISCPHCQHLAVRGRKPGWCGFVALALTVCLFPYGLLGFLAYLTPRTPTRCPACGFTWVA